MSEMNRNTDNKMSVINDLIHNIRPLIPDTIAHESLTELSSFPIKAEILKGVIACRIFDLSQAAYILFSDQKCLPGIIMVRAIIETTAMLNWLRMKMLYVVNHDSPAGIETFLVRMLFGSRLNPGLQKSYNILDGIDKIDKESPGFRATYNILCEYTHPNSAGTYFSYAMHDIENAKITFNTTSEENPVNIGLNAFTSCLEITLFALQHINDLFPAFTEICTNTDPDTKKENI